ncbi:hypothetical protein ABT336_00300 [Micromonospora sp. NPDC000207]|uniref:hypothetical protein n=1 Tax=Micromonospora sp. NPDC000207 TaxID=3154246 RepID=UPI00332F8095
MTLYVVIGPPTGGKSTWVLQQAGPLDVVIDYDRLAVALSGRRDDDHQHGPEVKATTKAARLAAIDAATAHADRVDVYLIHSNPGRARLAQYARQGAHIITIDPGRDVVLDRVRRQRPARMFAVVDEWYRDRATTGTAAPPARAKASRPW